MTREAKINSDFDLLTAFLYIALLTLGWFNIFAADYDISAKISWLDFSLSSTKQLMFIGTAILLIIIILTVDYRTFDTYAFVFYGFTIVLLIAILFFGKKINGDRSWFAIGSFTLQPSEFAKFATALALAKYLTLPSTKISSQETLIGIAVVIGVPMLLIKLQGDDGSALVFTVLILVLYREGIIPNWLLFGGFLLIALFILSLFIRQEDILPYLIIPILSIALIRILFLRKRTYQNVILTLSVAGVLILYIISVELMFNNFLEAHQKNRILVLIDDEVDAEGRKERYNLKHSLVAIGSGGLSGKGFLQGTQTKLNYVPEQNTDFIFCTIGEEYGWLGSFILISLYMGLLYRLVSLAERQKDKFARIYGYSVASILFFHFTINISMTIGLFPVIGIPLPLVSAGGSSLWGFTILIFIFLKMDAHRESQMERK